jgi:hypothetical protein
MNYEIYQWIMSETYAAAAVRGTARFLSIAAPAVSLYVAPVYSAAVLAGDTAELLSDYYLPGTLTRTPEVEVYELSALRMRQPF